MVWPLHQKNYTHQWMSDLCDVFDLAKEMIQVRAGGGWQSFGMKNAAAGVQLQQSIVVAPTTMGTDPFTGQTQSYIHKMAALQHRIIRTWITEFNGHDYQWTSVRGYSPFFRAALSPPGAPPNFEQKWQNERTPLKRQKTGSATYPPLAKPLFVCIKTMPPGGNIFDDVLNPHLKPGDSPIIRNPNGKTFHALCYRSAFKGHNSCSEKGSCRSNYHQATRKYGRDRLHVDLAEAHWSRGNYPEKNWAPVVKFIQTYNTILAPSPWLKELTPSTQWAP